MLKSPIKRIPAAVAAWAVTAVLIPLGLGAAFQALFKAWNVNADTVARAPGWARLVCAWHGSFITLISAVLLIALCAKVFRVPVGRPALRDVRLGHTGLTAAIVLAALFTLTDSLRVAGRPRFSLALIPLGAIMFVSALGEELLTKGIFYDTVYKDFGRFLATLVGSLAFFLIGGGLGGTVISGVNVALMGLLCCLLYHHEGLWTPVLFRWGWGLATVLLLGQGGGDHALLCLYGVSEGLFTGGDAGFAYGLAWTLILIGLIASMLYTEKKKG